MLVSTLWRSIVSVRKISQQSGYRPMEPTRVTTRVLQKQILTMNFTNTPLMEALEALKIIWI